MSLINKIYDKLNSLKAPISYIELSAVMGVGNTQARNAIRNMDTRGFPIVKERRYQEVFVSLTSTREYDYHDTCHRVLAVKVKRFIRASKVMVCDADIAKKFKIDIRRAHDVVMYLSRTNGIKINKKRVDGVDYYRVDGMVYKSKAKGNFDNHCIDHCLFNGGAMEALSLHKAMMSAGG